jgi:peptidoglycan/LPS O-acetylase OafA/YrhL
LTRSSADRRAGFFVPADRSATARQQPVAATEGDGVAAAAGFGGYLGQFDSYRVIACAAVVLQHSLLWTVAAGIVAPWSLVMLLHFSRTAFFFLTALVLTYAQITRPRTTWGFWRRRYVQLGVPYLVWTGIYWVFTIVTHSGDWNHAGSLLWHELVFGYYQLYFAVVLFQLYFVFPLLLRLLRASRHHARVMMASGGFALLLATDLHWPGSFGAIGHATVWLEQYWPFSRDLLTYQEQFVAGVLVALHFDEVRRFVERWCRPVIAAAAVIGIAATLWYLVAVWVGSPTGRASDLYQPMAFLWFTAAVAALECGTWWWYRRTMTSGRRPRRAPLSAAYLASLTGGIFLCHVLFLNLVRSALRTTGIGAHLGWAGTVAVMYVITLLLSATFAALVLRTPLRWVLGGPVRAEQRARLDALAARRGPDPAVSLPVTRAASGAAGATGR